jgi:CBS domain-containing protein
MKALDIMTTDIVSVRPDTPVSDIAQLLTDRRISGVPVIDDNGRLLGFVSQSDLLHRGELGTERHRKWWLRVFADPDGMAREYAKSHGLKATDVMTRHVVSVTDDAELAHVATVLDENRIKRVPVLRDGKMIGLIARSDLVRALSRTPRPQAAQSVDDAKLQRMLSDKMRAQPWLDAGLTSFTVKDGSVELWGMISSADQQRALRILVEETEGVKGVVDKLKIGRLMISGV